MPKRRAEKAAATLEDLSLVEIQEHFYDDFLGFVLWAFPWGEAGTELAKQDGPDAWQTKVMVAMGERIAKGDVKGALRIAVASGHGIGKTALVAWLIIWFITTRVRPQIVVTANTQQQLTNKTWRELAKWHKRSRVMNWFTWTATKYYLKDSPEDWFASAVPWSKENSDAFAGTHEEHVLIIFDEAAKIADEIWAVAEGAMTTKGAIWVAFGNPTMTTGRFAECFGKFKHRWMCMQVDSRTAKMADKEQIRQWIEDYGEDSDFVRIRVKGQFPRASSTQLISLDIVEAAMRRHPPPIEYEHAPIVIGVDVARFGDDQSVILVRQGRKILKVRKFRELDGNQLAMLLIEDIEEFKPAAVFVDAVGVGVSVIDNLNRLGYDHIEVIAQEKAIDERLYHNRRIEMWIAMRKWLKDEGSLQIGDDDERPSLFNDDIDDAIKRRWEELDQEFIDDLTGPEYLYDQKGRQQLEKKEDMKKRGIASPDLGDSLAMTFYAPVAMAERETAVERAKKKAAAHASGISFMGR